MASRNILTMVQGQRLPLRLLTISALAITIIVPSQPLHARQRLIDQIKDSSQWMRVEPSLGWCGARVIWLAARANEIEVAFDQVRDISRPDAKGESSLADILRALEFTGLSGRAVQCNVTTLRDWEQLALTVHRVDSQSLHALLLLGVQNDRFVMIDPFRPAEALSVDVDEFKSTWTGQAILISRRAQDLETNAGKRAVTVRRVIIFWGIVLTSIGLLHTFFRRDRNVKGVLLLAILCNGSAGCGRVEQGDRVSTTTERLHFQSPDIDLGTAHVGSLVRGTFEFRNISNRPVTIVDIETGCTCTSKQFPVEVIPPNGEGRIVLESNLLGRRGKLNIIADAKYMTSGESQPCPLKRLTMCCTVVPALSRTQKSITFVDVSSGVESIRSLTLRSYRDIGKGIFKKANLRAIAVPSDLSDISVSIVPVATDSADDVEMSEYVLSTTWTPKNAGIQINGYIKVYDDRLEQAAFAEIPISGFSVHPHFTVAPRVLIVNRNDKSTFHIKPADGIKPDDIVCEPIDEKTKITMSRSISEGV